MCADGSYGRCVDFASYSSNCKALFFSSKVLPISYMFPSFDIVASNSKDVILTRQLVKVLLRYYFPSQSFYGDPSITITINCLKNLPRFFQFALVINKMLNMLRMYCQIFFY